MQKQTINICTISGLDPSGGAGISKDLVAFEKQDISSFVVLTANTIQTDGYFDAYNWINPSIILSQLSFLLKHHSIKHFKIGIVENANVLLNVVQKIKSIVPEAIILWDPILQTSSGANVFNYDLATLKNALQLVDILTPNQNEWQRLKNLVPKRDIEVILKGGHKTANASEILISNGVNKEVFGNRLDVKDKRGTGCLYASNLISFLAKGYSTYRASCLTKRILNDYLLNEKGNYFIHNNKQISNFQFVSNPYSEISHQVQIENFLKAGGGWVQLRLKDEENKLEIAKQTKRLCRKYNATFIINDFVDIALDINADGVHLGQSDMDYALARNLLGNKIIGGTANNKEEYLKALPYVDYMGIGPYNTTQNKKNLSPVLGINGVVNLINEISSEAELIPTILIGGIQANDFNSIADLPIHGIALTGAISGKPVSEINQTIKAFKNKEVYAKA